MNNKNVTGFDYLGYFHKRDAELQNKTRVEINDVFCVCLCYDHYRNQDEKMVKIELEFEVTDTTLNKEQVLKLIQVLQDLNTKL